MIEFTPFPKIARLNRDIVITEKIDGTNAAIGILDDPEVALIYAQSRSRVITPDDDNFGFARWVQENATDLATILGPGIHFGEWWGPGIQRGYGVAAKTFSLFNTARWAGLDALGGRLRCVPVLYEGPYQQLAINLALKHLELSGSQASPGFMRPEGIVVWHTAAHTLFKVTLEKDEAPKNAN